MHGGVVRLPCHRKYPLVPSHSAPGLILMRRAPPSAATSAKSRSAVASAGRSSAAYSKSTPSTATAPDPSAAKCTRCISMAFAAPSSVFSAGVWKCSELNAYETPSSATPPEASRPEASARRVAVSTSA